METKYKVGDKVIISHDLNSRGMWIKIPATIATIVEVKEITPSFGVPYVLEVKGRRLGFCFWERDIDCKYDSETGEEEFWKMWGDK
tara:strand:- start:113 stop:370 length:258 start_codon:yes stop_codon:yes gene_type:complete